MSFQQGLSGLNAASKSLDVIGNNVANSSTVGFKQSQAQFADVYAASLNGSGASPVGIGTKLQSVAQQFTQGNITASNNPLDIAINGGGFFRLSTNGVASYSRNGQFQMDKDGFIVTAGGARLSGFGTTATGALSTGAPTDLRINTADQPPRATTEANAVLNLDSRKTELVSADFVADEPETYHSSTSVSVFDSLGNPQTLQTYYVKTAPNSWDVFASSDAATTIGGAAIGTLNFLPDGSLDPATVAALPFGVDITTTSGAIDPLTVELDFTGTTQFGSVFSVNTLNQDGYASGRLSGFNVGADGTLVGRYTNGQSATLGQVVLANFANPNGLQPLGNNMWSETADSGAPLVGTPNSGGLGQLQSSAVEDSNVDLTAELVNMITAQRFYQANAQTIKTQDQVLQTLVNLR
jgi:flagellar hook protein FlgE